MLMSIWSSGSKCTVRLILTVNMRKEIIVEFSGLTCTSNGISEY